MLPTYINVSLSEKTASTLQLRNLQKSEKWYFQRLTTFSFDLKGASNPFSKILTTNNFEFKKF